MKCLSVKQPWASALVLGPKDVENRSRRMNHTGWLLIHASLSPVPAGVIPQYVRARMRTDLEHERGSIIGAVYVTGCVPGRDCQLEWADGSPWAITLDANKRKVFDKPIPWRGQLGLYDVSAPDVLEQFEKALTPQEWLDRQFQTRMAGKDPAEVNPSLYGSLD